MLIDHYGLTPTQYSIAFSVNAVSFFGVAQLNGVLGSRFGLMPLMRFAVVGYAVSMVLLVALFLAGFDQLSVMIVLLFIAYGFLGLVVPSSAVIALDDHGAIAGTASALMGTLQFGAGIVMMAVVGMFLDGTAVPMLAGIAACSVIALALAYLTPQRAPALAGAPAE